MSAKLKELNVKKSIITVAFHNLNKVLEEQKVKLIVSEMYDGGTTMHLADESDKTFIEYTPPIGNLTFTDSHGSLYDDDEWTNVEYDDDDNEDEGDDE